MRGMQETIALPLFFLVCASTPIPVLAQRDPLQGFDTYVQKSMAEWQVPGLAIAVVKDEKVVFLKGYGVRSRTERNAQKTALPRPQVHGVFAIAPRTTM